MSWCRTRAGQGERTEELAAAEAKADQHFPVSCWRACAGPASSVKTSRECEYAPGVFAKEPEARQARVGMAALVEPWVG